jgi:hypothetical protein
MREQLPHIEAVGMFCAVQEIRNVDEHTESRTPGTALHAFSKAVHFLAKSGNRGRQSVGIDGPIARSGATSAASW